jgi:hypothetical protein
VELLLWFPPTHVDMTRASKHQANVLLDIPCQCEQCKTPSGADYLVGGIVVVLLRPCLFVLLKWLFQLKS